MTKRVLYSKRIHENGAIEERVIWSVPRSPRHPEGIKYRLAFVKKPKERPLVLYDNHHPKGHHKHIRNKEMPYDFTNVEQLLKDFEKDIKEVLSHENT